MSSPHNARVSAQSLSSPPIARPALWRSVLRHFLQVAVFNLVVAIMLTVLGMGRFDVQLVYSQAIGLSIWALIDFGRLALSRGNDTGWPKGWRGPAFAAGGMVGGFTIGSLIGDLYSHTSSFEGMDQMPMHSIVVTLVAGGIGTFYFYASGRAQYLRAQAALTERDLAETQLKLLESQLEPHMLFNTLANLRVLIALDPERAQAMLDRLIAFLRATLSASRATTHPLGDEFERVDDYLALMKVRMGDRLSVRLRLPPELADLPVPSLLLQPLVENAIKHGLEPHIDGGRIDVSALRQGDDLVLVVRDTGAGLSNDAGDGTRFGLVQVRQRLATLYGDLAHFELSNAGTVAAAEWTGSPAGAGDAADNEGGTLALVRVPVAALTAAAAALGPVPARP